MSVTYSTAFLEIQLIFETVIDRLLKVLSAQIQVVNRSKPISSSAKLAELLIGFLDAHLRFQSEEIHKLHCAEYVASNLHTF